jgi:hypothetical protein
MKQEVTVIRQVDAENEWSVNALGLTLADNLCSIKSSMLNSEDGNYYIYRNVGRN